MRAVEIVLVDVLLGLLALRAGASGGLGEVHGHGGGGKNKRLGLGRTEIRLRL